MKQAIAVFLISSTVLLIFTIAQPAQAQTNNAILQTLLQQEAGTALGTVASLTTALVYAVAVAPLDALTTPRSVEPTSAEISTYVLAVAPAMSVHAAPDAELRKTIAAHPAVDPDLDAAAGLEPARIRELVAAKIKGHNLITASYKHVDGTSFAAPIVTSVAAQMLEANPVLTPQEVKHILILTARRVPHAEVDRQGWGVVDPEAAVAAALEMRPRPERRRSPRVAEAVVSRGRA